VQCTSENATASRPDINAEGVCFENALQATSSRGYEKAMKMLLEAGAEINAEGGEYSHALQAAL
jgi:hypothetical protein